MKYLGRFVILFLILLGSVPRTAAQCMSGYSSDVGTTFKTTGDAGLDRTINAEASGLSQVFGVTPALYTLDDQQASNAYANCQDGVLLIGLRLLREELWSMERGGLAVAGIMAHEFAHIYQCRRGTSLSGRDLELQADYLAGWYMRHNKSMYGIDISGFARTIWSKGDYDFRSPSHHGTPEQRVAAMNAGFNNDTTSTATAYADSSAYLGYGSGRASSTTVTVPRVCERKVACQHATSCQHTTSCQHPVTTMQLVACQHPVMTPYGYMPAHQADQAPVTTAAHRYDVAHPGGDQAHSYDTETYDCSN